MESVFGASIEHQKVGQTLTTDRQTGKTDNQM